MDTTPDETADEPAQTEPTGDDQSPDAFEAHSDTDPPAAPNPDAGDSLADVPDGIDEGDADV